MVWKELIEKEKLKVETGIKFIDYTVFGVGDRKTQEYKDLMTAFNNYIAKVDKQPRMNEQSEAD